MPPTLAILIPAPASFPSDLLARLLSRPIPGGQIILIGPQAPDDAASFRSIRARGNTAELLNRGIDASTADYLLFLHPGDHLNPDAIPAVVHAAADHAGCIAGFRFCSPLGDLRCPSIELPALLALGHLIQLRPVPSAVLLKRTTLAEHRLRTDLTTGAELDLLFRLAENGHRFAHDPATLIRRPLIPLPELDSTLQDLAAHVRILADCTPPADLATTASDLIDAIIVLRAHQRSLTDRGASHLAAATRFPHLYGQWWHRCGFFGPAPRHVLDANGGLAEAISADPALIARRILSLCPRSRPPILLGLGRNARAIARALHSAGTSVIGRDDSLSGPPTWAADDSIPVEVIPATAPFDPAATYIMTVLHDDAFIARLPTDLRIIRWRTTPDLILAEWRSAALDWALRTGLAEPKPALAGAPV